MDFVEYSPESKIMHKTEGVSKAIQILMKVFTNQEEFRPVPGHPVITTFHEYVKIFGCVRSVV